MATNTLYKVLLRNGRKSRSKIRLRRYHAANRNDVNTQSRANNILDRAREVFMIGAFSRNSSSSEESSGEKLITIQNSEPLADLT